MMMSWIASYANWKYDPYMVIRVLRFLEYFESVSTDNKMPQMSVTILLMMLLIPFSALSLRNLVLGYEYGRVFSAGGGSGSPSRDAANWLPSRFSLSVETRRRYG